MTTRMQNIELFILTVMVLNLMPGPDLLLVMTQSGTWGWRAGVMAALGIGTGILVHVVVAACGLSALLAASPAAFTVLKFGGAVYIVIVGLLMLRASRPAPARAAARKPSNWKIFAQGFLTDVLNPKVALFFLAFVPQFVATDAASKSMAFLGLGLIFDVTCIVCLCVIASGTAYAGTRLGQRPSLVAFLKRLAGGAFVLLGVRLALS